MGGGKGKQQHKGIVKSELRVCSGEEKLCLRKVFLRLEPCGYGRFGQRTHAEDIAFRQIPDGNLRKTGAILRTEERRSRRLFPLPYLLYAKERPPIKPGVTVAVLHLKGPKILHAFQQGFIGPYPECESRHLIAL